MHKNKIIHICAPKIYLLIRLIIKKNPIYVILDNFEKFQVNSKLNNSIMSIKKSLNNN